MPVPKLTGVSALASILIDANLLGNGAIKHGAPDLVLFNSGGPATELAKHSILCGPSRTRVVIRQPENWPAGQPNNALAGDIELLSKTQVLTAEIEEWKHGCWYHANIISATGLGDLLNKLHTLTPKNNLYHGEEHLPNGAFWAGTIAYEMVHWTQPISISKISQTNDVLAVLWLIENHVIHSIETDEYTVYGSNPAWVDEVESVIASREITTELPPQPKNNHSELSSIDDLEHIKSIEKITNSISNGMFYQVNFGRFWSGELIEHPMVIFQRLTIANPAPYATYVEAVDLGIAIASSSPETLLRCHNRILSTAPIKGTVTRGASRSEDLAMIESMIADVKERSEHRMLVDLMRNDLSSICKVGSVNISRFDVESYANVHHLVSHIKGELLDECTSSDALNAIFPGGSITGCPRTMVCAAIDQIETTNRSFWTGSVGWFDPHSDNSSWNILIRTLEAHKTGKRWAGKVGAGGGITIRSDPKMEVAEAVWKSQAIRKACGWLEPDFDLTNVGELERTSLEIENTFDYTNCGTIDYVADLEMSAETIAGKVLIIDNLDSFTLNIAHAIAGLGYNVCVVNGRDNNSKIAASSSSINEIFEHNSPSHLILGPGPGKPQDSVLTMKLATLALEEIINLPVLGVCLGHQAIGVAEGFQLIKDPNGAIHGTPVTCQSDGSGLYNSSQKSCQYVRYNSLLITGDATSKLIPNIHDDYGSIMGIRHSHLPIHGIQFHPESIGSVEGVEIFKSFLALQSDA